MFRCFGLREALRGRREERCDPVELVDRGADRLDRRPTHDELRHRGGLDVELARLGVEGKLPFDPEEVAALVAWLLSDDAPRVNGQVWDVEQYPLIGRNPPKDKNISD